MNTLKLTASVLSVLFALGTTQTVNASVIQPINPTTSSDNFILVHGGHGGHHGAHHHGHHGHHGWHGHHHGWSHGWRGHHHGWWGHHGYWRGGVWYNVPLCGWHNGIYYPC